MIMRKLAVLLLVLGCAPTPAPTPARPNPIPLTDAVYRPAPVLRQLQNALAQRIAQLDSGEVGLAFVDLETGRRIGINDLTPMHAASTMKVPVLVELFRQAEEGKLRLEDSVIVRNEFRSIADSSKYSLSAGDDSDSTLYRRVGQRATLHEMARLMIARSSNLATNNLIELVGPANIANTLARFDASGMRALRGVEDGPAFRAGLNNQTTADGFARSLEIIARCKATSRAACAGMTNILAAQEFKEMIPAGLPAGTRVANKTGWITRVQHDGAIVFPPNQWPYVLVVLTRGIADRDKAARLGADLSRIVWSAVTGSQWITRPTEPRAAGLFALHRQFRNPGISERQFTQEQLRNALTPYVGTSITTEKVGESAQGRPLHLYKFGNGPTRVLFWSQMHGNESTATMSLTDLFRFIAESPDDPRVRNWSQRITLYMLPMLNPDGAARFQRQNAYGIDVNRDARALVTPEGRTLKAVHDRIKPQYGFNLHDQNPRTRVGNTSRLAAIALLAPVKNAEKTDDEQLLRAKRLAGTVRLMVEEFVGGHVTRYDDTFNPRAFGDLIQTWGTEAVLIESGGWYDDPDKQYLRATNFAALVTVLDAMANQTYLQTPLEAYTNMPPNGRSMVRLLITGGTIVPPQGPPYRAEITADVETAIGALGRDLLRITEVGDIVGAETQDTVDVRGMFLHHSNPYLLIGGAPSFVVRKTADPRSEILGTIENGRWHPSAGRR